VWVGLAASAVAVPPNSQPVVASAAMREATGLITRHIAGVPPIGIGLPRTGLGALRAVIRSPNARRVPGNKSLGRAGILPVGLPRAAAWATGPVLATWAAAREAAAWGIPALAAERIGSAAAMSRVPAVATVVPSEVVPGNSAGPVRVGAVVAASPAAWDLAVVEEASGVAAAGVDRRPGCPGRRPRQNNPQGAPI
jgi:hypothetical protein